MSVDDAQKHRWMLSIAEEEFVRFILLEINRDSQPLSVLIAELLVRDPSVGKTEVDVFICAHGDKESGGRAYRESGKSLNPVVIKFCRARLRKLDAEDAIRDYKTKLEQFLQAPPAA